jgi:hypothetical protein
MGVLRQDYRRFAVSMADDYIHIMGQRGVKTRRARILLGHMYTLLDDPDYMARELLETTTEFLTCMRSAMFRSKPHLGWGDIGLGFVHLSNDEVSFEMVKGLKPWLSEE